jgi:hypothetical protein
MQQDADFITADFLYMFRASCAHHQEYKILTQQPPVQVVMAAGGSSLRHIRDETTVYYIVLFLFSKGVFCGLNTLFIIPLIFK